MNEATTNQGGQKVKTKKDVYQRVKVTRKIYRLWTARLEGISEVGSREYFNFIKYNAEKAYKLFTKALDQLRDYQEKHGYNA